MIEALILPDNCPCTVPAAAATTTTGTCQCNLTGTVEPEGVVVADVGIFYSYFVGGEIKKLYMKAANAGSAFGWQLLNEY